jgi:hypothetical protein
MPLALPPPRARQPRPDPPLPGEGNRAAPATFHFWTAGCAIRVRQFCACEQRDLSFQGGKADHEESLLQIGFFLLGRSQGIIAVEIAGKIYPPSNVAGEPGVGTGEIFELTL